MTVTNPGPGAATISSVTISGQYTQTNNCPASLAAGASLHGERPVRADLGRGAERACSAWPTRPPRTPLTVSLTGTGTSDTTNLALGATMSASSANGGFPAVERQRQQHQQLLGVGQQRLPAVAAGRPRLGPAGRLDHAEAAAVDGLGHPYPDPVRRGQHRRLDLDDRCRPRPGGPSTRPPATRSDISLPTSSVRYVRVTITANTGWPAGSGLGAAIFSGGGGGSRHPEPVAVVGGLRQPDRRAPPAPPVP